MALTIRDLRIENETRKAEIQQLGKAMHTIEEFLSAVMMDSAHGTAGTVGDSHTHAL